MSNVRILKSIAVSLVLGASTLIPTFAQGTTTLRNPLIPGAQSTGPGIAAAEGMPPPVGSGPTPVGVNPGMSGDPTLLPWVPAGPANNIDEGNSGVNLPVTPSIASPPGVLGPALTGIVPGPPSTPGADPGMLQVSPYAQTFNPALETSINAGGGLPGTGGFGGSIPNARRGGQQTHQWEMRGRHMALGAGSGAKGSIQDEVARTGPLAGYGIVNGIPTGYGFAKQGGGSDFRNSSIDLGGGQRIKISGIKLSTGSSIQDFGISDTRNNSIAALNARRSTEFGQGFHRIASPYSHNTTDFGLAYKRFNPANVTPQKQGQLMLPNAVETQQ